MDAEQHFGTLASVWDDQAEAMDASMGEHGSAARRALAAMPGERILDVGCGPGLSTVALRAAVGAIVTALEKHRGPEGLAVPAASWCVTARRP